MKKSEDGVGAVNSERNLQAELGTLLQKERGAAAARQVDEILKSSVSLEEKITRITAVDLPGPEKSGYLSRRTFEEEKGTGEAPQEIGALPEELPYFDELRRARLGLKAPVTAQGFWSSLFHDFSRVRAYGRKSHIFSSGFLFFQLRFNPSLKLFLTSRIQKDTALHLLPGLIYLQRHAWQFLSKEAYNSLALLCSFAERLVETNFAKMDFRKNELIDRIRTLEGLYLSLRALPGGMDTIFAALDECYTHIPALEEKFPRLERYVNMLVLQDFSLPSFANFILGANMLKFRRYLTYTDLIPHDLPQLISHSDWECSPETYIEIRKRIGELEEEISPLIGYYDEILRMVAYLPATEQGGIDYGRLQAFWDRQFGTGEFVRSRENISRFTLQFCTLLAGPVRDLLCGAVLSAEGRSFRIFANTLFAPEFSRIDNALEGLEKLTDTMPTFPRERFVQLKQSRRGSIPAEAAIIQKVSVILSVCRTVANRLIATMKGRLTAEEASEDYPPIDSVMTGRGGFFLPFEHERLATPAPYAGLTPADAIHETVSLLLPAAVLLEDHEISALLKREAKLKQKIAELGRELHRLAGAARYRQLREALRLELFGL